MVAQTHFADLVWQISCNMTDYALISAI